MYYNRSPRQFHDVSENVALLSQDLGLAHGLLAAHARLDVHQVERRVSHVALEAKTINKNCEYLCIWCDS